MEGATSYGLDLVHQWMTHTSHCVSLFVLHFFWYIRVCFLYLKIAVKEVLRKCNIH